MSRLITDRAGLLGYLAVLVLLAVGVTMLTLAAGGTDESVAARGSASGKAPVVGRVVSVSGKATAITVKSPGGREHRLREGDQLHLNDVIDPDRGVEAILNLKIPNGVSGNDELVYIAPGKGDRHTITMERTGKLQTKVLIGD